ncbi:MAG: hypothetical protein CMG50_05120 [Candidatus Marinimicrobia bacterium]|nr:hypothetical protein [Candidatus Neomarinimicrobiota bacterium]
MNKENIYNISTSNNQLLLEIINRVDNDIPSSIIRKSDGENVIIGYKNIKGIKLRKYLKKLRHFNISYFNFSFQKFFRKELINSFYDADYIGVPIKYFYYGYTSSVRKFEPKITNYFLFNKEKYVDNHFQLEFIKLPKKNKLKNPLAEKLITNKKIGLITHFDLNDFFLKFDSKVLYQKSIPKRDLRKFNLKMSIDKYNDIINFIKLNANKVDIWFLAAGAYAKPFSNYIKKYNGIAVDLGSVIDTWSDEFHSRKFLRNQEWEKK